MATGKGLYIYQGIKCGVPASVVETAVDLGLSWIAPRIAYAVYPQFASYPDNQMADLVSRAHMQGILVYGWHYICGGVRVGAGGQVFTGYETPEAEAKMGADLVGKFGLDGYIANAEKEYKVSSPQGRATKFVKAVKPALGGMPFGLTSYRFPTLHLQFPWAEFLGWITEIHPQVYWNAGASVSELERCIREYRVYSSIPVTPIGRAYSGEGFPEPTVSEVQKFLERAIKDLPGASFWSFEHIMKRPALVNTVRDFIWQKVPSFDERLAALEEKVRVLEGKVYNLEIGLNEV